MRFWSRLLLAVLGVVAFGAFQSPADAANNSFLDDDNSRYEPFIETALEHGLVNGCNPPANDRVCPHDRVTRGQTVVMLARALGIPPSNSDHFVDDDGHVAERAIDGLIDAGVSIGCGIERICPDRPISRGEMAALFTRAFGWGGETEQNERFVDVADSPFREPLMELVDRGGLLACDAPLNRHLCPDATVRRDEAIFALVAALRLNPDSVRAQPDLPSLGFGDGFTHLSLWDGRTPSSRNRVRLYDDGFRNSALRVDIPRGSHFGADFHLHLADRVETGPERLFFRYFVRFDDGWRTTSSGKLPGFSGVYGSSGKGGSPSRASEPGWSARLMFGPNHTTDDRIDLGYYVYHLGQETRYGDGLHWNEAGKLNVGQWYCLEGEVALNTPGLEDGALRAWVDGTPAFDLSGLAFRRPGEPEIQIESFWFNVYHGGKALAPKNLGLNIDEVAVDTHRLGCGEDEGGRQSTIGDVDGNGYADRIWWDECPGGTCFWVQESTWTGRQVSRHNGDGAWFSLAGHRLGLATGDVDGDGSADLVYYGRCGASSPCWRVHQAATGLVNGDDWGDQAVLADNSDSIVLGDWNGDGLDDIVYRSRCGEERSPCWRSQQSSGDGFRQSKNLGWAPRSRISNLRTVDLFLDGRDDLVYQAACDESLCWFAQISTDGRFEEPFAMGPVLETSEKVEWVDFDGDSSLDLVSWTNSDSRSWIEVRYVRDHLLSEPVSLAALDRPITDVAMRRMADRSTVQAVVETTCDDGKRCVERLMSPTPARLVDSTKFRDARWARLGIDID